MLEKIVKMVDAVEDGKANPLEVYAELDQLVKNIDLAKKQIFEEVMVEAEKYDKTFQYKGFEFNRRVGGGRYDYKGVTEHVKMKKELTAFEKQMQLAYKAYHNGGGQIVDEDSGELVPIPEYKTNKDSISVKKLEE